MATGQIKEQSYSIDSLMEWAESLPRELYFVYWFCMKLLELDRDDSYFAARYRIKSDRSKDARRILSRRTVNPELRTATTLMELFLDSKLQRELSTRISADQLSSLRYEVATEYFKLLERHLELQRSAPAKKKLDFLTTQSLQILNWVLEHSKLNKQALEDEEFQELARMAFSIIVKMGQLGCKQKGDSIGSQVAEFVYRGKDSDLTDPIDWRLMQVAYHPSTRAQFVGLIAKLVASVTSYDSENQHVFSAGELSEILKLMDRLLLLERHADVVLQFKSIKAHGWTKGLEPLTKLLKTARTTETETAAERQTQEAAIRAITEKLMFYANGLNPSTVEVLMALAGKTVVDAIIKLESRLGEDVSFRNSAVSNTINGGLPISETFPVKCSGTPVLSEAVTNGIVDFLGRMGLLGVQTVAVKRELPGNKKFLPLAWSLPTPKQQSESESVDPDRVATTTNYRKISLKEQAFLVKHELPMNIQYYNQDTEQVEIVMAAVLKIGLSGGLSLNTEIDRFLTRYSLSLLVEPKHSIFKLHGAIRAQLEQAIFPLLKENLHCKAKPNDKLLEVLGQIAPLWSTETKCAFLDYVTSVDSDYPDYIDSGIWNTLVKIFGVYKPITHPLMKGVEPGLREKVIEQAIEHLRLLSVAHGRIGRDHTELVEAIAAIQEKPARGGYWDAMPDPMFEQSPIQTAIKNGGNKQLIYAVDAVGAATDQQGIDSLYGPIVESWTAFKRRELLKTIPQDLRQIHALRRTHLANGFNLHQIELAAVIDNIETQLNSSLSHDEGSTAITEFYGKQHDVIAQTISDIQTLMAKIVSVPNNGANGPDIEALLIKAVDQSTNDTNPMPAFWSATGLSKEAAGAVIKQLSDAGLLDAITAQVKAAAQGNNLTQTLLANLFESLKPVMKTLTEQQLKDMVSKTITWHTETQALLDKMHVLRHEIMTEEVGEAATMQADWTSHRQSISTWFTAATNPQGFINTTRTNVVATLREWGFSDPERKITHVSVEDMRDILAPSRPTLPLAA